jgi:hypothetical protein
MPHCTEGSILLRIFAYFLQQILYGRTSAHLPPKFSRFSFP